MIKFCLNKAYIAALLLLGCVSCGDPDLFDTDKWSDNIEGLEPNVQLKVAHGSFTLWDLSRKFPILKIPPIHFLR